MNPNDTRIAFCLPGLHRVTRGAEVALESLALALARLPGWSVTLIGSGAARADRPYRFLHAGCRPRERFESWPSLPLVRTDGHYEELTFLPGLARAFSARDYDVVVTCSYPFVSWAVRALRLGRRSPLHAFVTQNGDWPLHRSNSEYRFFDCDALVCTNPDYYDAHGTKWPSALIPNGVDCSLFFPGEARRAEFDLPDDAPVVLMVSALISSKRVLDGIRATASVPDAHFVVAGDGPLRDQVDALGRELLGQRFHRRSVARKDMPALYRSASVFLHMSLDEPSANAYIEALATGLPIVTHDRRVTRWTLEKNAKLVNANDLGAVSRALTEALTEARPAAAAVDSAKRRFDWSIIAAQYATFLRERIAARD